RGRRAARWRGNRASLHPEDAEARVFRGGVGADGKCQSEDAAGVRGIDHAVVPKARRGVIGMALALVLLADRRLEGLFLLLRPLALLGLDAVALDGRQHRGRL